VSLPPAARQARDRLLRPGVFPLYLWLKLPLAACAGLRLKELSESRCVVRLPGGWRTQNPFRSTYFAAQAMAAEMSTGAPAMVLLQGAPVSISMLVRGLSASFTKKATGPTLFAFEDVAGMRAVIDGAAACDESREFTARSVGRMLDGTVVAEFDVQWTFRRRPR
jgi:hypothetical protein